MIGSREDTRVRRGPSRRAGTIFMAAIGITISIALVAWTLRTVSIDDLIRSIREANLLLLVAAIAVATSGYVLRAIRWRYLLDPFQPNTAFRTRFAAVSIGFMLNNLLPARMGEVGRIVAIHRLEPVKLSGATGSLVVERFLDAIALLVLLFVALQSPAVLGGNAELDQAVRVITWASGFGVIAAILLVAFPKTLVRIFEHFGTLLLPRALAERAVGAFELFLRSFEVLRRPRLLVPTLFWTFAFWCWHALSFWLGFRAFGMEVGYEAGLLVSSVVGVAVAAPSSPGFIGTFHAGAWVGLQAFGIADSVAFGFAYAYHLGGFVPITVIGLFYANRMGFSLAQLSNEDSAESDIPQGDP